MLLESFNRNFFEEPIFELAPMNLRRSSYFDNMFDRRLNKINQINTRPKMRNIFDDEFFTQDPLFNRTFDALDLYNNGIYETQSLRPMKLNKMNKRRNGLFENSLFKDFDQLLSLEDVSRSNNLEKLQQLGDSKNAKNSTGFSLSKRSVTKNGENVTEIDRKVLKDGKILGDNMKKVTNLLSGESEIFKNGDIQSELMELKNDKKSEILPIESEIYEEKQEEDKKSHPESDDVIIEEI